MCNRFIVYFSVILLSGFAPEFTVLVYGQSGCEGANWGSPLERTLTNEDVNSPFNQPKHDGTDYIVADGDNVLSVADGNVLVANGSDFRPDDINRLGQKGQGWGKYVVIKHNDNDGSTTLYAHLQEGSTNHLYNGMPINKGDTIGKADSTGGVSGPHLHLEYAPNGRWRDKLSRVNPHPCIVCSSQEPATVDLSGPDAPTDGSQYTATGGIEPYTWSITKGSITQTGVVTVSGQCGSATVSVTDICGNTQTKEVRMSSGVWVFIGRIPEPAPCTTYLGDFPRCIANPVIFGCDFISGKTKTSYFITANNNVPCVSGPTCTPCPCSSAVCGAGGYLVYTDFYEWRCP